MRYAVISDVHSNLEALRAVLADIKENSINDILFAGDAVGYGPDPNECLKIIEAECSVLIAGNHDWAASGLTDIAFFNTEAQSAMIWTITTLTKENLQVLSKLKISEVVSEKNLFVVHSTPKEPQRWSYLLTNRDAAANFDYFDEKICFLGHSHIPFIAEKNLKGEAAVYKDKIKITEGAKYIVNVGSVGQPRDGDPRACYCIFDEGLIYFRRVAYEISKTQKKMRRYGLPRHLIERLLYGA
jgi:predicted phosphodiesterase